MSTKSKSSTATLSDTSNNNNIKASPATPKIGSRLSRGVSKSESESGAHNPRITVDRSPRSVTSKPSTPDWRSPSSVTPKTNSDQRIRKSATTTTPDKQPPPTPTRALKGSELQAQLNVIQEDLKNAKERLVLLEKEKAQAIDEFKEAQKSADEANEKLREALVAQKRAEENSEIEKFRAVEMEQAGIESAQKKEEEWVKEVEAVRNQHAADVSALISATQELQTLRQELTMTCDAKNQALSHADDATKVAEIHAEKAEILSAELAKLKSLLDSKIDVESSASEKHEMVMELKSEVESLKIQLENAKKFEEMVVEKEGLIEQLNVDLEAAKMAEYYACNLMEEWKSRVEELEERVSEANKLERSASESLETVMKQLEGNNDMLHDAKIEITSLKEKVGLLEMTIGRQRNDLEESEKRFAPVKEESSVLKKKVESLTSELESLKEEKIQLSNNEKLAATSVLNLLEEKNQIINDLEKSRDEEEKSKKAMESLASALHEVSAEAREAKEKLLYSQAEQERCDAQIDDLKLVLKTTNEKYEMMIDDAKHEVDVLTNVIEQSKIEKENLKVEWEQKEIDLIKRVDEYEGANSSFEEEVTRLANLLKLKEKEVFEANSSFEEEITHLSNSLKEKEKEASESKDEAAKIQTTLKEAESEVVYLKDVLGEAKAESMRLKESLLDNENELQNIIQENDELRAREADSHKKIEELKKLLEESMASKNQTEENGELSDSEKDYDMLPKVVEFSEQNGGKKDEKPVVKDEKPVSEERPVKDEKPFLLPLPPQHFKKPSKENQEVKNSVIVVDKVVTVEKSGEFESLKENKVQEDEDSVGDFKMWESCNIGEKDLEMDQERESFEDEVDSKIEGGGESNDNISSSENHNDNDETSPLEQHGQKKKKAAFLKKFGSLLKKKGTTSSNHK